MATIANLYHTDLTTKTQLLIAENVDLEKVITKCHPQTKETFVLYSDNTTGYFLAKINNNTVIKNELIVSSNVFYGFNFSLNYLGSIITIGSVVGGVGTTIKQFNSSTFNEINSGVLDGGSNVINVTHTGTDEQYYIAAGYTVYRYNADTQSVMYGIILYGMQSAYYNKTSLIVSYASTDIQQITDNNSDFEAGVLYDTSIVPKDILYTDNKIINLTLTEIQTYNLDYSNPQTVSLSTYNLSSPSGLATEITTNRVLFSSTDNATGNRNLYELKSDNTIELITGYEKLGGYSNNNDLMGGQLDLAFK